MTSLCDVMSLLAAALELFGNDSDRVDRTESDMEGEVLKVVVRHWSRSVDCSNHCQRAQWKFDQ